MTIKDMLNEVLLQSGHIERSAFFVGSDPDDKQMGAIANRVADEIINYYTWPALRKSETIAMVSAQTSYPLPADFQSLVPDSAWEFKGSRKVNWPVPDSEWYMYKYSALSTGATMQIKMYGDRIETVEPIAGETFSFEYISNAPVLTSAGDPGKRFKSDSDTWILDDQMLILGIQANWQQAKMMPSYQEHMINYRMKLNEAIGRVSGAQTIGGQRVYRDASPYTPLWIR